MTSLIVSASGLCLNIKSYDVEQIRATAEAGGVLYWDNEGAIRKVPNGVLRDVVETYDDWMLFKQRHPETDLPRTLGWLYWDQAVNPRGSSARERAQPLRHRPTRLHRSGAK